MDAETYLNEQCVAYRTGAAAPGVEVREDEEGEYLYVPFEMSSDFLAEIDGDTYGRLFGFRMYDWRDR